MKKLLIIHHFGGIGGAGLSLLHIIRAIDNKKYQVYVLCPKHPDDMLKALKNENCIVVPLENELTLFNHYNGGIKYAFSPRTISNILHIFMDKRRIGNYIKSVSPDVVITNSMTLFWIGKIAKKMGLKTVCFHRETYQKGLFSFRTNIIKRGLSRWFDKIAFISKFDLQSTGKTLAKKQLIYDRVDFGPYCHYSRDEARKELGLNENGKYILFLGGVSSLKGAEVIINAMKYISREQVKLLFVGDVESIDELISNKSKSIKNKLKSILGINTRDNIYNAIKKYNMEGKVEFKKRNIRPELFYSACNLIVFPSTLAHQSRPIYEAGIAKIPIIITDFPETNEFAKNGLSALTFKNKDAKELADKIKIVIDKKDDINKIVENNYQQVIKNHNFLNLKEDVDKLLEFDT